MIAGIPDGVESGFEVWLEIDPVADAEGPADMVRIPTLEVPLTGEMLNPFTWN